MTSGRTTCRAFLAGAIGTGTAGIWVPLGLATAPAQAEGAPAANPDEASQDERAAMAEAARAYMQTYDVPGLSIAIGRAGRIVHTDAFGLADREKQERLTPMHLFRIASITKPITSVAIFSLIEQGRLRIDDRVFGPRAILGTDYGAPPYRGGVAEITIEHLLTHTSGGWGNQHDDPMFMNPGMNHAQLIAWTLRERPLEHPPGESYAYSNFGYCVLGRVIEKITRRSYPAYVAEAVLKRCGITDMAIAGNTLSERRRGEVKYYGQGRDNPYAINVARMDSHGGWIARPTDIAQFVMHVSSLEAPAGILKPETLRVMTTGSTANPACAKCWMLSRDGNWWHDGTLAGTATIMVRARRTGLCWAGFANTRRRDSKLEGDLDRLIWSMIGMVTAWRA
jgi:CubicO group peptidase (beta-lactamase class C family)